MKETQNPSKRSTRECSCLCPQISFCGIDHRLSRPHTNMLRVKYEIHTGETWSAAVCATWAISRLSSSWRLEREPDGGRCNADISSCPTCNGLDPCIYHMYTYALLDNTHTHTHTHYMHCTTASLKTFKHIIRTENSKHAFAYVFGSLYSIIRI